MPTCRPTYLGSFSWVTSFKAIGGELQTGINFTKQPSFGLFHLWPKWKEDPRMEARCSESYWKPEKAAKEAAASASVMFRLSALFVRVARPRARPPNHAS